MGRSTGTQRQTHRLLSFRVQRVCIMPGKYKLIYFNARGLAEASRWILVQAGAEYEDHRFKDRDEWMALKPSTPLGQAPLLEVDGKFISQSKCIARYLAKQFGLLGDNDMDQARADMIVDFVDDLRAPLFAIMREENEENKAKLREKYASEQFPTFLETFEKVLKENNGGDGYFVGDKVSWADLYVVASFNGLLLARERFGMPEDCMDKYEKLKALIARVEALPAIAKW